MTPESFLEESVQSFFARLNWDNRPRQSRLLPMPFLQVREYLNSIPWPWRPVLGNPWGRYRKLGQRKSRSPWTTYSACFERQPSRRSEMVSPLEQMLIEAEARYLTSEQLDQLKAYVLGWPKRQHVYRALREGEAQMVGRTLEALQKEMPNLSPQVVDLCRRHLLLLLRHSALAMLLQDENLLKERLIDWMEEEVRLYGLQNVYEVAHRLFQQELKDCLQPGELEFIRPLITRVQAALLALSGLPAA